MSIPAESFHRLEEQVSLLAEAVSAVADDNLRVAALLTELAAAGVLPPLPWRLATFQVELSHAQDALRRGYKTEDGTPVEERVRQLEQHIVELRQGFRDLLPPSPPTPEST